MRHDSHCFKYILKEFLINYVWQLPDVEEVIGDLATKKLGKPAI